MFAPAARCLECSLCLPPCAICALSNAIWSHGDSLGGPCAAWCAAADETCFRAGCVWVAAHVCRLCTDCVRTCVSVDVRRERFR
eukprot:2501591-Prymnesium_polylepis.1